jgi:tripartite-type tricarboxylate transporter receptor subunit TctC
LKESRLKAVAVSTAERSSEVPSIPLVKAAGGSRGVYDVMAWFGHFAPASVPDKTVDTIQQDVTAVLNEPDVRDALQIRGYVRWKCPGRSSADHCQ